MFELIGLVTAATAAGVGYVKSRSFVASRLRYVDAIQSPAAPVVAGVAATAIATPIVWVLPVLGVGTAVVFGIGVGAGTRAGIRLIRRYLVTGN